MSARASSGFNARTVLLAVLASFAAFIATLYFIGMGDTGRGDDDGRAHAASNGLNGYAGLAKLLELEGHDVRLSRNRAGLETYELLIMTPPMQTDPEEFAQILEERFNAGPTIVILPKWWANQFPDLLPSEISDQVKDGWVQLSFATDSEWTSELPELYAFEHEVDTEREEPAGWNGMGLSGVLPANPVSFMKPGDTHDVLVRGPAGNALAFELYGEEGSEFYEDAYRMIFIVEPDLVNNYGLADKARADLALQLVREIAYEDNPSVTFDLTLNGLGGAQNLLTLVFTPPFLAATLCLIAAMIMIGWRAFRRFGPARAEKPAHAFGKSTLVSNSSGMILRAKRFPMLKAPYAELIKRRIARKLGLVRYDSEALDAAVMRVLPGEPPLTSLVNNLREARAPKDILGAAESLHEIERKLTR